MWKALLLWLCFSGYCYASPLGPKRNMPIISREEEPAAVGIENEVNKPEDALPNMPMISTLTLPSNATSIRADITDGFSCANKSYGYYADIENECQIFHVCLPVTYADGKENTFRWSFICPEETIFSQDSFTCMRREDMTIDCEESFKYYELNRNFGMTDEENIKNPQNSENNENIVMTESQDQETSMTSHIEHEHEHESKPQPTVVIDEKIEKPNSAIFTVSQINTPKEKPMKVQKPNRRKPSLSISSNIQKKKPTMPLRKTTQPISPTKTIETAPDVSPDVQEEIKPAPPRFTKRPSTMSTNLKDKLQTVKQAEALPTRVEIFNQKRKRPTFFHKKDATTSLPTEDAAATTELPSVLISVTNEKQPVDSQTLTDDKQTEESKEGLLAEDNIVSQASEPAAVAVNVKDVETLSDNKTIDEKKVNRPQPTEPEAQPNIAVSTVEETPVVTPIEAIEEIPAIITEVEEITKTEKDNKPIADSANPSSIEDKNVQPSVDLSVQSPNIFQQNSEENSALGSSSIIEEMEDKKPADAPEIIMTATPDMEHQDPIIEEMFPDREVETDKQTMGGFKPVDPAMAAEAEALIADFLHTLIKTDQTNSKPIMPSTDIIDNFSRPAENQDITEIENTPVKDEMEKETTIDEVPKIPVEETETLPIANTVSIPNIMSMMNTHHGEPFQIPVQIIETPIEDLTNSHIEAEAAPSVSEIETKPVESIIVSSVQRPLSIDDVVELVKEQLDQVPATEKDIFPTVEQDAEKQTATSEIVSLKLGEEPILPIYHRVSSTEVDENMLQAHNSATQTDDQDSQITQQESQFAVDSPGITASETKSETTSEMKTKTDRAQRARNIKTVTKMDPRKRRFLFRSDAS